MRFSIENTGHGSFSGQTGNPVQLFISSGSANRNFYYEDSTQAAYVLTAKAGYGTSDSWDVLFETSHNSATDLDEEETTPESNQESGNQPSNTNTSNSAHYGSVSISTSKQAKSIDLSAGRDRLGSVGSPLEFKVEGISDSGRDSDFEWNFGDGFESSGGTVTHAYEYPGEYIVVLNAELPEGRAVARINVRIVEAEIIITLANAERVEVTNNSKYEINLHGRALWSEERVFVFPQDTIIKAGQKISFSSKATGLHPTGIHDVSTIVIGENATQSNIVAEIEEEKLKQIASIESEISVLQERLAVAYREQPRPSQAVVGATTLADESEIEEFITSLSVEETLLTASAVETIPDAEVEDEENWFQLLKRFFLKNR